MVNWATALSCKRCAHLFQAVEAAAIPATIVVPDTSAAVQQAPRSNIAANVPVQNDYSPNDSSPDFNPQLNWANDYQPSDNYNRSNQNYNQGYSQNQHQHQGYRPNYGQNNYQPNYAHTANQKIGLAVTSMIFGILGMVTAMFLIGLLFAPIGAILGIVALIKAKKKPLEYGGQSFAIAGTVTGVLITLFIPVVAAIAIPNLLAARRAANEGSTVSTMQTLADAETSYRREAGNGRCADLNTLASTGTIDPNLSKGEKSGYRYSVVNYPLGGCEINATPLTSYSGRRSFYFSTDDSLIRIADKDGKPADKNDKLLGDDSRKNQSPVNIQPVNETVVISTLRTIHGAQMTYQATSGAGAFASDLQTLSSAKLIKESLADGEDGGYGYRVRKISNTEWQLTAVPLSYQPGMRSFYIDSAGVIKAADKKGREAENTDMPVGN
jgi:type II secretory pathway pseudopilin PulG